jgi:hypothetical protein
MTDPKYSVFAALDEVALAGGEPHPVWFELGTLFAVRSSQIHHSFISC